MHGSKKYTKKKFHLSKKELPIPFFKESAAGYASWKTKKTVQWDYMKNTHYSVLNHPRRGDATTV